MPEEPLCSAKTTADFPLTKSHRRDSAVQFPHVVPTNKLLFLRGKKPHQHDQVVCGTSACLASFTREEIRNNTWLQSESFISVYPARHGNVHGAELLPWVTEAMTKRRSTNSTASNGCHPRQPCGDVGWAQTKPSQPHAHSCCWLCHQIYHAASKPAWTTPLASLCCSDMFQHPLLGAAQPCCPSLCDNRFSGKRNSQRQLKWTLSFNQEDYSGSSDKQL